MAVMASVTKQSTRDRVLFIDDAQIQSMHGVQRRIHPGARFEGNPLLRGDRAWESGQLMLGTVLKEDGLYRMWYGSGSDRAGTGKAACGTCMPRATTGSSAIAVTASIHRS